jgi:fibronectin-binding autotransporter adhesin
LSGHTVNVTANGAISPSVTINSGGRLNLGTTIGHTFTTLAGGGILSLAATSGTPTYPTVTTNTHITTAGSTIEFTSSNNYTIPAPPNGATTYRNLITTGGGTKTLGQNTSAAETLLIDNATSLQVNTLNLTVSGNTTINGLLLDNSATGTTSLQNVTMNGGVINGTNAGIYNINGTLNLASGTNIIGQSTITVTGVTTLSAGTSVDFNSTVGNKTFNGAVIVNGN